MTEPTLQAVNILIVGEPAETIASALEPMRQSVGVADTEQRALELLSGQRIPVAVVWVRGAEEIATATKLRARSPGTALILVSDNGLGESLWPDGLSFGLIDFLPAGFHPRVLRTKVSLFLHLAQKTEQLRVQETALRASSLLSSTMDYETTLQTMAKLVVPELADWCALDMVKPGGGTMRLAVQHLDPAKLSLVSELERRHPPDPNAATGVPQVIRTGAREWMAELPAALIEAGAKDAEHLRLLRALALKSYISVPISARGRVLGVLTLVMAESGRIYTEADVARAEDLAARAGQFLDNSRLYQEAMQARTRFEALTRELKTSEVKFRSLAEAIPQQVWTAGPDGGLDFVNARIPEYFARPASELLGNGWATGVHPDDAPGCIAKWVHCLQTGEPYEVEFRLRRGSDATYRWHLALARAEREPAGTITRWFGSNTDIDDRKRTEQERERLIRALERTNADLDQFAYAASHDLKAPLRGIANLSQWIEEDLASKMTDESREHMALLRGRVNRLEGLIDGILGYSRVGRTEQKVSKVDSGQLVKEVVDLLAPPPTVSVKVAGPLPSLTTQKAPLEQVFMNLVGNAIKHGRPSGAQVTVSAREAGPFWQFSVADNGPGIAAAYHEKIWGIFQTLQARDKVEGTGIGLAVVRKIVESKAGRAWVESTENQGATFHFTWPRAETA